MLEPALGTASLPPAEELAYQLLRLAALRGCRRVALMAYRDDAGFGFGCAVELWGERDLRQLRVVPTRVLLALATAVDGRSSLGELDVEVEAGHVEDAGDLLLAFAWRTRPVVEAAWEPPIAERIEALVAMVDPPLPSLDDHAAHPAAPVFAAALDACLAAGTGVELLLGGADDEASGYFSGYDGVSRITLDRTHEAEVRDLAALLGGVELARFGDLAEGTFAHHAREKTFRVRVTHDDDRVRFTRPWLVEGYEAVRLRCQPVEAPPPETDPALLERALAGEDGALAVYADALEEHGDSRGIRLLATGDPRAARWLGRAQRLLGDGALAADERGAIELVAAPTEAIDTLAWAALAAESHWRAVTRLWLTARCPPALCAYLLQHAPLTHLEVLVATHVDTLAAVGRSAAAASLQVLAGAGATSSRVAEAVGAGALPRLRGCAVVTAPYRGQRFSRWGDVGQGGRTVPMWRLHRLERPSLDLLRELAALPETARAPP